MNIYILSDNCHQLARLFLAWHDVEDDSRVVKGLDHVLVEARGAVLLVGPLEELHGVVLDVRLANHLVRHGLVVLKNLLLLLEPVHQREQHGKCLLR